MNKLLPATAILLVIAGFASVNLWRELRNERQLTAELRSQLADARESLRVSTAPQMAGLQVPPPPVAAPVESAPEATPAPAAAPATTTPNPATATSLLLARSATTQAELMKDPEYRKARLAQIRLGMSRNYPGLVEELGLSEQEADDLFDLLSEQQLAMTDQFSIVSSDGQVDQARLAEATRLRQQQQRDLEDALLVKLGGARFSQWQQYQQTRPARMRVVSMNTMLAQSGQSLSEAQMRPLTTAMIAEQQRQQTDMNALLAEIGPTNTPEAAARVQQAMQARQQESNRRILEAATPHLTSEQLAALKAQFDMQDAMSRASSRVLRVQSQSATP